MATTPRKSVVNIVEEVKQKAKVEIITAGTASIAAAFDDLKIEVTQLKGFDPTYVAPWEIKQKPIEQATPVPSPRESDANHDSDTRVYRKRNAKDAIVLAVHSLCESKGWGMHFKLKSINVELIRLGYTYAYGTLSTAGNDMAGGTYTDPRGRTIRVRRWNKWNSFSVKLP